VDGQQPAPFCPVRLQVNGVWRTLKLPATRLLLDVLRDDLGLMGTKENCRIGVCGVCTVLMDEQMVSSCLLPAVLADGRAVTTIEGLASDERLDPIQLAFIEHGGFQCGICTPGQVLAARALLTANPSPSEAEVREWMVGNLCRCTGYYKIIESVLAAAQRPVAARSLANEAGDAPSGVATSARASQG
jgi:carbon-monoxide dehydrogenase small subunit